MSGSSTLAMSRQERIYQTKSLFNRNKMYYDANNVAKIESLFEIKRRIPHSNSLASKDKFDNSFLNSTAVLTDRLEKDISRFKGRLSLSRSKDLFDDSRELQQNSPAANHQSVTFNNNCHNTCKGPISPPQQKIKGVPMGLVLPRPGIVKTEKGPQDERLFNNFKLEAPNLNHTVDFGKLRARKNDISLGHINDLVYDTTKEYQQFYYPISSMKCVFNYKVQDSSQGRVFMDTTHPSQIPATILDPEKIAAGFNYSTCFGANRIQPFYFNSGKQLPPQLQMRTMKDNENQWRQRGEKPQSKSLFSRTPSAQKQNNPKKMGDHVYIRPRVDFSIKQMKTNELEKRKQKMIDSKKVQAQEDKVCMEYYFRRQKGPSS